jgi:hypothetical protein
MKVPKKGRAGFPKKPATSEVIMTFSASTDKEILISLLVNVKKGEEGFK